MHRKGKIVLVCLTGCLIIFGLFFYFNQRQLHFDAQQQATGKIAETVLKKNIAATNAGDLTAYLATIAPAKRQQTEQELAAHFDRQKQKLTLKSFKLQQAKSQQALAKVAQLQFDPQTKKQQIIETNVEFIKAGPTWYINKSILYNLTPIK